MNNGEPIRVTVERIGEDYSVTVEGWSSPDIIRARDHENPFAVAVSYATGFEHGIECARANMRRAIVNIITNR